MARISFSPTSERGIFGIFKRSDKTICVGSRIGNYAIDLNALHKLNYFDGITLDRDIFNKETLNDFLKLGKPIWRQVRDRIAETSMQTVSYDIGSNFQVKRITVMPGKRLSLQGHNHRKEHWTVVLGEALVEIDGNASNLKISQSIDIPLGSIHRLSNKYNLMIYL